MTKPNNQDFVRPLLWHGHTSDQFYGELRHQVCDYTKSSNWPKLLDFVERNREHTAGFINTTRPGGKALFAPLHHAAWNGAPVEVVQRLVDLGAWRTLRCSDDRLPLDIAKRQNHKHLLQVLTPLYKRDISLREIRVIQIYFHAVIRGRADHCVKEFNLRLPELEPMLEYSDKNFWFTVPKMAGGFHYWLEKNTAEKTTLMTESWCRMVGGSGERHEITSTSVRLVESGFV